MCKWTHATQAHVVQGSAVDTVNSLLTQNDILLVSLIMSLEFVPFFFPIGSFLYFPSPINCPPEAYMSKP